VYLAQTAVVALAAGGNAKVLMFVALSPSESCSAETLCSLNFASRVAKVELGQAKRNMVDNRVVRCHPPSLGSVGPSFKGDRSQCCDSAKKDPRASWGRPNQLHAREVVVCKAVRILTCKHIASPLLDDGMHSTNVTICKRVDFLFAVTADE
jgi:hypothetical protein